MLCKLRRDPGRLVPVSTCSKGTEYSEMEAAILVVQRQDIRLHSQNVHKSSYVEGLVLSS